MSYNKQIKELREEKEYVIGFCKKEVQKAKEKYRRYVDAGFSKGEFQRGLLRRELESLERECKQTERDYTQNLTYLLLEQLQKKLGLTREKLIEKIIDDIKYFMRQFTRSSCNDYNMRCPELQEYSSYNEIQWGIRHWGTWVNPYDAEDEEDYDYQELEDDRGIFKAVEKFVEGQDWYVEGMRFYGSTQEKNWIDWDITIPIKLKFNKGGKLKNLAMKDFEKNNIKEEDFPKDPENITKDELHEHFDLDNDGKVNIEEYSEHVNYHCNNPKVLEDKIEQARYNRGFKYAEGGLTPNKAKKMLKDGTAQGKPLTDKQKRYFGHVSGGGKGKYAKGGKTKVTDITLIDIEKSWSKYYGEDFKEEYWGLYDKLKTEKNLTVQKLDKLWAQMYGEDFKYEYYSVYEDLGGIYTKEEKEILEENYKYAKGGLFKGDFSFGGFTFKTAIVTEMGLGYGVYLFFKNPDWKKETAKEASKELRKVEKKFFGPKQPIATMGGYSTEGDQISSGDYSKQDATKFAKHLLTLNEGKYAKGGSLKEGDFVWFDDMEAGVRKEKIQHILPSKDGGEHHYITDSGTYTQDDIMVYKRGGGIKEKFAKGGKIGDVIKISPEPYMASFSELYGKNLTIKDIKEINFASGLQQEFVVEFNGKEYKIPARFTNKFNKGGRLNKYGYRLEDWETEYKDGIIRHWDHTPSEWYVQDQVFNSLNEAKKHIDRGSPIDEATVDAYSRGLFKKGGKLGETLYVAKIPEVFGEGMQVIGKTEQDALKYLEQAFDKRKQRVGARIEEMDFKEAMEHYGGGIWPVKINQVYWESHWQEFKKGGKVKNEKITVKSDFMDLTYLNRELNKVNKAIQSVLTNKNDNGNIIELERRKLALNKLISYKQ